MSYQTTTLVSNYGYPLKSGAIGELGYLAKYGNIYEGKFVENHVFPVSSARLFFI
jgi:hypothetical protein